MLVVSGQALFKESPQIENEKKLKGKKIAFFDPGYVFTTNPSLMSIAKKLISYGCHLEIYHRFRRNLPQIEKNIVQYPFPQKIKFCITDIEETLRSFKWYLMTSAWKGKKILKKKRYDLVFGISSGGIIAADNYAKEINIPTIYLSYEIFFKDELQKRWEFHEKEKEICASRDAKIIVVQDIERASLLKKENSLRDSQFIYIPVSSDSNNKPQKTNYLRAQFNIPENKKIVLHSGSFEAWNCANEIIGIVPDLPENVVLVIHTKSVPKKSDKIMTLAHKQTTNLIISTIPLGSQEYEEMVSSADIGLAFYKQAPPGRLFQKNIKHMGLSSGKFSSYVKYGLPVITLSDQSTYQKLIKEYSFGKTIASFDELPEAINSILSNYNFHSKEAKRLFAEKLDFNIFWPDLSQRICEII